MNYLLDTHIIIWYFDELSRLPKRIENIIDDPNNSIYISTISLFEIVLKKRLRKLNTYFTFNELLADIKTNGFKLLQIKDEYLNMYIDLPLIHTDPFDGLLITTAICEDMTLITSDSEIQKYDCKWLWSLTGREIYIDGEDRLWLR